MPAEILAIEFRIIHSDVFGIPECVLGIDMSVADDDVAAILERIVSLLPVIVDVNVGRMHEEIICAMHLDIAELYVTDVPHCFGGIGDAYPLKAQMLHFTEHLRRFNKSVAHIEIRRIPQCCACAGCEHAVFYRKAVDVPKRIFTFKPTSDRGDVAALFQGRFTGMDCHILKYKTAGGKKRPLAAKFFISDSFHHLSYIMRHFFGYYH